MTRKRIGVLLCEPELPQGRELLRGIGEQAFALDYDVLVFSNLFNQWENTVRQRTDNRIFEMLRYAPIDGLIIEADRVRNPRMIRQLERIFKSRNLPAIVLNRELGGLPCLMPDDTADFAELTTHFLTVHGMKKLYCLTGPKDNLFAKRRLAGFRQAMEAHGVPVPEGSAMFGDFWYGSAQALADRILSGEVEMPEAVLCGNDEMAAKLCEVLIAGGLRIPQDIAVAGFDAGETRRHVMPLLTSCAINHASFGANAMCQLHERITGTKVESIHFPGFGLLASESCGCKERPQVISAIAQENQERQYYEKLFRTGNFFESLILTPTLTDCAWHVIGGTYLLRRVAEIHLCLRENWQEQTPRWEPEPYLEWRGRGGTVIGQPERRFAGSELLPALNEERTEPCMFHFTPLYCVDEYFGHIVLSYGANAIAYDDLFRSWSREVGTAFVHLRMQAQISSLTIEAKLATQRDALTGLYNQSALCEFFLEQKQNAMQEQTFLFLALAQVENLSEINRTADQQAGDAVLIHISELLLRACSGTEKCARLRSGEFCVIGCCEAEKDAAALLSQFRLLTEQIREQETAGCLPRIRIGLRCLHPDGSETAPSLLHALRRELDAQRSHQSDQNESRHFERMQTLRQEIHQNLEKDWNVDLAAGMVYLSRGYFQMLYKKYFGICFSQDLINCRLTLAKQLLTETDLPVQAVMARCGFETYAHFLRLFKKNYGCTIQEYRQRLSQT